MGKLSRTKGHTFERNIAQEMQEIGFPDACRHLEYQDGEAFGIDLKYTAPFYIQCKRWKNYAPINKIFEICTDVEVKNGKIIRDDGIPMLITKGDNMPTMCCIPWFEMKKMIKQLYD